MQRIIKGDEIITKRKVINSKKAVMIGCGFVGSASVFALMQSGLFTEIVLIDADKNKAEGEAMDISHGIPFASPICLHAEGRAAYRCQPERQRWCDPQRPEAAEPRGDRKSVV